MVCTVIMQMSNMRGQFHDCAGGGLANIWTRASIRRKEQYSTFEGSIRIGWKGREEGDSFEGRKKLKEERGSYLKEGEPRFKEGCKYKGKGKQRKVMPRLQLFSRAEEGKFTKGWKKDLRKRGFKAKLWSFLPTPFKIVFCAKIFKFVT